MFTILSFCGGGIRGLASATILENLVAQHPGLISGTNMFAGTSTGGTIIANLVNGTTPAELVSFFLGSERNFFANMSFNPFGDPTKPQYDINTLKVDTYLKFGGQTLGNITPNVLFTSFAVGNSTTPWQPLLFHNFSGSQSMDVLVADAVLSTAAMPGMLGSYSFGSYPANVDGAFVNHDPTLAAIALAVNSGIPLTDIAVLCFGTGFMANWLGDSATASWGPQQWQQGDTTDSSNYYVPPLLINGSTSPILNMSLAGTSTNTVPLLAGMLLPGRYAYLNPSLPYGQFIAENETNEDILAVLQVAADAVPLFAADAVIHTCWPS